MDWIEVQLIAAKCKACKAMGATKQRDQLLQRNAALPPLSSWLGELRQAYLWLHMISSFYIVVQSFSFFVQTQQMGKSHDLCPSLKHCTQTNLARRKAAQAQAADARRDSARQTPWHRDTWLHMKFTAPSWHLKNSKDHSEASKFLGSHQETMNTRKTKKT